MNWFWKKKRKKKIDPKDLKFPCKLDLCSLRDQIKGISVIHSREICELILEVEKRILVKIATVKGKPIVSHSEQFQNYAEINRLLRLDNEHLRATIERLEKK